MIGPTCAYTICKNEIKYVEKYQMFYQLGKLYTWKMTTEVFEYSGETMNTGIPEIDSIQKNNSTNILDFALRTENGLYLLDENGNYIPNPDIVKDTPDGNIIKNLKLEISSMIFSSPDPQMMNFILLPEISLAKSNACNARSILFFCASRPT